MRWWVNCHLALNKLLPPVSSLLCRLFWQVPQRVQRQLHSAWVARVGRTDQKFPFLQLHRLPEWLQGEARCGLLQGMFPNVRHPSLICHLVYNLRCKGFAPANYRFRSSCKRIHGPKLTYLVGISLHGIKGSDPTSHLLTTTFFFYYSRLTLFRHRKRRGTGLRAAVVAYHASNPTISCAAQSLSTNFFLLVCVHGDHVGKSNPTASQIFKMSSRCNALVYLRLGARTGSSIFPPKLFLQEASVCFLKSAPTSLPRYSRPSCLHGGIRKGCWGRWIHGSTSR